MSDALPSWRHPGGCFHLSPLSTEMAERSSRKKLNGDLNTAIGSGSLSGNTAGFENTAIGAGALSFNTEGTDNTAIGERARNFNTTGSFNTAVGESALSSNAGDDNTAIGVQALSSNQGIQNTAVGEAALSGNTTGISNTAIGLGALEKNSTGSGNTALGIQAGFGVFTANNVICIGTDGADVSNSCFIGNIRDVQTQNADAVPVLIDSAGQLSTLSSSRRFKKEIRSMDKTSEAILVLKPVRFQYKNDSKGTPQFGLIAEEVAKVNPDLVVRDKNGEIYTVRYDAVNAMLLNEFLKEHRKVEEQERKVAEQETTMTQLKATVTQQQKNFQVTTAEQKKDFEAATAQQQNEIQALTASLKDQAAQIQKVSAQLEVNKIAPQIVLNNQ
jgi:hypothetical protein